MSRKSKKLAFEVNGKENVDSQRHLWEHDIIRGRNQYGAYNNLRSVYLLAPSPFFFLLLWKRQISLLACHWSPVKKALDVGRFFSEKFNFFSTRKNAQSCRKRRRRWRLKKDVKCEHSLKIYFPIFSLNFSILIAHLKKRIHFNGTHFINTGRIFCLTRGPTRSRINVDAQCCQLMSSSHCTILARFFTCRQVLINRRQMPDIGGKSVLVHASDNHTV